MNSWLENLLEKMKKWFFVNALILELDIISLLIDGLFYKALAEAPQAILTRDDANALKIPVLVFVILVCIIQLTNISFSIYIYLIRDSNENEQRKKDWPIIISMPVVLIDFLQIVIALTTAFRTHRLIGKVQINKAVFGLIKTCIQIPGFVILYYDRRYCPRVFNRNPVDENSVETSKGRHFLAIIILVGFVCNFLCSFALLARMFMFL